MLGKTEWWNMIRDYNSSLYPMQLIVMAVGAVLALIYVLDKKGRANTALKVYFALCFLWIGIMFFWVMGTELKATRWVQGGLFIAIGALFALDIYKGKIDFTMPKNKYRKIITIVFLLIVMSYPFVGMVVGRQCDAMIYVGMLPCATTAFALVLVTAALPKKNLALYILLLIWAIPFPPMVQIPKYGVYEDGIMFVMGLYALGFLIANQIKQCKNKKKIESEK